MNRQRGLACLLVVIQAVMLAYCFGTPVFSTLIVAGALVGWRTHIGFASVESAQRWPILIFVLYVLELTVLPAGWLGGNARYLYGGFGSIAQYSLLFQVAQFFVRHDDDRLPTYFPILAIIAFVFIGDVQLGSQGRLLYQLASLGLVGTTVAYFLTGRLAANQTPRPPVRSHHVVLVGVLLATGAAGWIAASNLFRFAREIEAAFGFVMAPAMPKEAVGFSGKGRLGSVARQKNGAGDGIALRVHAVDEPGYLRGRIFDRLERSEWHTGPVTSTRSLRPSLAVPAEFPLLRPELNAFAVRHGEPPQYEALDIWPNQSFGEVLFTPLELCFLEAPVDRVSVDVHDVVVSDQPLPRTPYVAWRHTGRNVPPKPVAPREELLTQLVALPEDMDPRIVELAREVAGDANTTEAKIQAIEQYFHTTYEYRFGIRIPPGEDPLTFFLLEKPAAHCEYFASGAAVLLRALAVPCRYVTGFVAAERNRSGDYWLARNRDAHAWVEAYDPARGWVVVEATPSAGVPQRVEANRLKEQWDALRFAWQRTVDWLREEGVRGLLLWLRHGLISPWGIGLVVVLTLAVLSRWIRRRLARPRRRTRDPQLEQLQHLLERMDDRWRRVGLNRGPHETLHQFAARISDRSADPPDDKSADWYRRHAELRFSGCIDATTIMELRTVFEELAQSDSA